MKGKSVKFLENREADQILCFKAYALSHMNVVVQIEPKQSLLDS
jgi:hypothetical protein